MFFFIILDAAVNPKSTVQRHLIDRCTTSAADPLDNTDSHLRKSPPIDRETDTEQQVYSSCGKEEAKNGHKAGAIMNSHLICNPLPWILTTIGCSHLFFFFLRFFLNRLNNFFLKALKS